MRRTNMRSDTNGWLTVKTIAAVTGYNPEYIRQLIRAGSVAARKVGARLFVNQESLVVYQSSRANTPKRANRAASVEIQANGPIALRAANRADPRLVADPYLTDPAIRRQRNEAVIAHFDALSMSSPVEVKEQRATYLYLRKVVEEDRLSSRKRFRKSARNDRSGKS